MAPLVCQHRFSNADFDRNNDIFTAAVWNLLIILSKWPGFDRSCRHGRCQQGLTLELGAYSPSDSKHTFRNFRLEQDYPYQEKNDLETHGEAYKSRTNRLGLNSLNDPYHGWVDGRQDYVNLGSKLRIIGTLSFNFNHPRFSPLFRELLKVDIVTGLLIRRQFYRKIAVISLGKLLRETYRYR